MTDAESEREVTASSVFVNSEGSISGCDEKKTVSSVEGRTQIRGRLEVSQDADELGKITLSWSSVVCGCHDDSDVVQ